MASEAGAGAWSGWHCDQSLQRSLSQLRPQERVAPQNQAGSGLPALCIPPQHHPVRRDPYGRTVARGPHLGLPGFAEAGSSPIQPAARPCYAVSLLHNSCSFYDRLSVHLCNDPSGSCSCELILPAAVAANNKAVSMQMQACICCLPPQPVFPMCKPVTACRDGCTCLPQEESCT